MIVLPYTSLTTASLSTEIVGATIRIFDEIDSTNTFALEQGTDGMVIVADHQTSGRGRLGRSWHSAPGLGIWFTIALDGVLEGITFAAALAVRDALADRCSPTIKWPNDVLINGKKVCGILTEHRAGITALGIGLNVHHRREDFPEELREKAGSLETEAGSGWQRVAVLRDILNHLDQKVILLRNGGFESVRAEWAEACGMIGRVIRCDEATGTVSAIDELGALILETDQGEHRLLSGDITFLD